MIAIDQRLLWSAANTTEGEPLSRSGVKSTVFVVNDDVAVREYLRWLIQSSGWLPEICATARQFLSRPSIAGPKCLVLDVQLADANGLDLQRLVTRHRIEMPVIFISSCIDVALAVQAMKAGAVEFLVKPFKNEVVLKSIHEAIERSRCALLRAAEIRILRGRYASLTPREREVLALVATGRLNKQVGSELGISEITVKAHRGKLMSKMKAASLVDLVNMVAKIRSICESEEPSSPPRTESLTGALVRLSG